MGGKVLYKKESGTDIRKCFLGKISFCGHSSFFAKKFAMIHEFCPVRDKLICSLSSNLSIDVSSIKSRALHCVAI